MPKNRKLILIVLDGVGIGALPDAYLYNDSGANTLCHIAECVMNFSLPALVSLGLGNVTPIQGVPPTHYARGGFGKMAEASKGKDSTTGHWELLGIITEVEFPTYPHGFPTEVLDLFMRETGCIGYLGNKVASGTEIIRELGDEHVRTGYPIIYTSADSVFQVAAHEEVIPVERLYEICQLARTKVLVGEHRVGRVIARPFIGTSGAYSRTPHRRDFAVEPPFPTMLDVLTAHGIETVGIGKIDDLLCGRGVSMAIHTHSNAEGIDRIIEQGRALAFGCIVANLVDFDMLYGHRQDVEGFAKALMEFDRAVPEILSTVHNDDLVIITADHGNDPTDTSTDHTREFVPVLTYSPRGKQNVPIGTRQTFADVAQTIAEFFEIIPPGHCAGTSFYSLVS
ncbi:MAG: phosphopentomutase [Bacteroidetes bacterium]|nr:phosphopentomutase [Bacteroidota bacterium]